MFNETADDCGLPGFPTPGPNGGYWHGELSVGYGGFHKGLTIYNRTNRTEVGPEIGFGWATRRSTPKIITAQLAVGDASKYPEFAGNAASVDSGYLLDMEQSAGNQCYHWNNNAQSYWLGGQAMARAFLALS